MTPRVGAMEDPMFLPYTGFGGRIQFLGSEEKVRMGSVVLVTPIKKPEGKISEEELRALEEQTLRLGMTPGVLAGFGRLTTAPIRPRQNCQWSE